MTSKEAWRAFIYKHQKELIESQYAVESAVENAILLMQAKRFKYIHRAETGAETEMHINFSDVTEYTYYVEQSAEAPEVLKDNQLVIKSGQKRVQMTVSPYDMKKMNERWVLGGVAEASGNVAKSTEEEG